MAEELELEMLRKKAVAERDAFFERLYMRGEALKHPRDRPNDDLWDARWGEIKPEIPRFRWGLWGTNEVPIEGIADALVELMGEIERRGYPLDFVLDMGREKKALKEATHKAVLSWGWGK